MSESVAGRIRQRDLPSHASYGHDEPLAGEFAFLEALKRGQRQ